MRFTLNRPGVEQVVQSTGVAAFIGSAGRVYAAAVRSSAPRHTGYFAGSISVGGVERSALGAGLTVSSSDPFAHLVEWGSANNAAYAPFRKAAGQLGLRIKAGRR